MKRQRITYFIKFARETFQFKSAESLRNEILRNFGRGVQFGREQADGRGRGRAGRANALRNIFICRRITNPNSVVGPLRGVLGLADIVCSARGICVN